MRLQYTETTLKKLFALSGNMCAFPGCKQNIIDEDMVVGEICHIEAAEQGGERYNKTQTNEERRSFGNLVLLCANHHKITNNVEKYSVEKMKTMKKEHEKKFEKKEFQITDEKLKEVTAYFNNSSFNNVQTGSGMQALTQTGSIIQIQKGMNLEDVTKIFELLFRENFPNIIKTSTDEVTKNVHKYLQRFSEIADGKLTQEDIEKFADPDVQYILKESTVTAARNGQEYLHNNLSNLVIGRIKNNQTDIKKIVYDQAIQTVSMLTANQIKILTLVYIITKVSFNNIPTIEKLDEIYTKYVSPFLDFRDSQTDYQHIEYSRCGSMVSILSTNLSEIIKKEYSFWFHNGVSADDLKEFKYDKNLTQKLFIGESPDMKFGFLKPSLMGETLTEWKLDEVSKKELVDLYYRKLMGDDKVKEIFCEKISVGKILYEKWQSTAIKSFKLTSVGIVIAASNFEQILGEPLNIDIWIN